MKNKKISIKTIVIIVLIGIIIAGIIININNKNTNIEKQSISKEQLGETTTDNAYVSMSTHLSEINAKQQEIDNMQNTVGQATATESQILKNYTAYKDGKLITGTMANNGALSATLNAGASYTIPAGYTSGGKVTANSLESQTSANATAANITKGKTAWVNGKLITGTGEDSSMQLPYYVFPGTSGYTLAYYNTSFTSAPAYGTTGLFGTYNLKGVSKLVIRPYSCHASYGATVHVSLSDHIPTSLDDMKSSPVYETYTVTSPVVKTIEIPSNLDTSKEYWLLFYSNSSYGNGYTSVAVNDIYFN